MAKNPLMERWMGALGSALAPRGWRRLGNDLRRPHSGGFSFIHFQGNRYSDPQRVLVRATGSFTCEAWARFVGDRSLSRTPRQGDVAFLFSECLPNGRDQWWSIRTDDVPSGEVPRNAYFDGPVDAVVARFVAYFESRVAPIFACAEKDEGVRDLAIGVDGLGVNSHGRPIIQWWVGALLVRRFGPEEHFDRLAAMCERLSESQPDLVGILDRIWRRDFFAPGLAPTS